MKTVRITAKTVGEAVEEGLKKLGLSRAEAVIRVVEQPSSGLFGLFNKKDAVVEVGAAGSETEDGPSGKQGFQYHRGRKHRRSAASD